LLKAYRIAGESLEEVSGELTAETICRVQWIDLSSGSDSEKSRISQLLDIELEPINEYEPFKVSSHFSATKRQLTMTGLLLMIDENDDPHLAKITFIRAGGKLITVSDGATKGLTSLIQECENCFTNRSDRDDIFATILDMIVDHTDNILDKLGHDLERINDRVFQHHQSQQKRRLLRASPRKRNRQLESILTRLGPTRETLVKLRRSVLSFRRMIAFLRDQESTRDLMPKLQAFEADLKSIEEAESDLSATAGFLLDGVVGYIGLLQNNVMNILTLITLLLTPAMVIAAIYGMNFKNIPELQWTYGYPLALLAIVVSTAATWLWVRARGLS
jgi:magnesium transporter